MLVKEKNYKLINRNLFSLKVGILIPIIIINNFNQIPKRRLSSENDGPLFQQTRQRYSIKRCSVFCCSLQSRRTTALSFSTSLKLKQRKMFLTFFHKKTPSRLKWGFSRFKFLCQWLWKCCRAISPIVISSAAISLQPGWFSDCNDTDSHFTYCLFENCNQPIVY